MIVNRVPLLKPKLRKADYYELWWGFSDGQTGALAGGSLEQMAEELELLIDHYSSEYYCSDWERGVRARLIHRQMPTLQWILEIKEVR